MSSKCKPIQGLGDSPSFNLKTLIVNYGIRQIPICRKNIPRHKEIDEQLAKAIIRRKGLDSCSTLFSARTDIYECSNQQSGSRAKDAGKQFRYFG